MDPFTFWAALAQYLAWPLVILFLGSVVLFAFKSELKQLIMRIATLKAPGWELQFREDMQRIEAEVTVLPENVVSKEPSTPAPPLIGTSSAVIESPDSFVKIALGLAEYEPYTAVLFSWATVESAINVVGSTPLDVIRHKWSLLTDETVRKTNKLKNARDTIVHGGQSDAVTYSDAVNYVYLAKQVLMNINQLLEKDEAE